MILKEISATCREKFLNTSYLTVLALAIAAEVAEDLHLTSLRDSLVVKARERYWIYVNERHREFDVAVSEWQGSGVFNFVIKRYTARGVNEIKTYNIKADAMHQALARLLSYNHGPGFAIISKSSPSFDHGIWAEITNAKTEFLPEVAAQEVREIVVAVPNAPIILTQEEAFSDREGEDSIASAPNEIVTSEVTVETSPATPPPPPWFAGVEESASMESVRENPPAPPTYRKPGKPYFDRILAQPPVKDRKKPPAVKKTGKK